MEEEVLSTLPHWLQFLGPILVALITSGLGLLTLRRQLTRDQSTAKKDEAEAAQAIQEAAVNLLAPYQEQVDRLTTKVCDLESVVITLTLERNTLRTRVEILEEGVDILIKQLEEAGITPKWVRNGGPSKQINN